MVIHKFNDGGASRLRDLRLVTLGDIFESQQDLFHLILCVSFRRDVFTVIAC